MSDRSARQLGRSGCRTSTPRAAARMVDVGAKPVDGARGGGARARSDVGGGAAAGPRRRREEGRSAADGAARRHHGRQADVVADPALPSAAALERRRDDRAARDGFAIEARVRTTAQTGVEMEALTAVSVAALTLYDMVKAVDKTMTITDVELVSKRGGQSGDYPAAGRRGPGARRGAAR